MDRKIPPLRLYMVKGMVKGSFITANNGAAAAMDVEVWSRLPEDLIWEVLRFVPAATYFRLQLVNRRWRQVLTSADFRNRLIAAAASRESEQRVVAYVIPAYNCVIAGDEEMRRSSSSKEVKVVDIDLSSFVPGSFWKSDSYSVMAAADGLVCICNDGDARDVLKDVCVVTDEWHPETTRYCVLNLMTRTCKVLPRAPFEPRGFDNLARGWRAQSPTGTSLTIFDLDVWGNGSWKGKVSVANYDLQGAASGGSEEWDLWDWEVATPTSTTGSDRPLLALCAGAAYLFYQRRVHVLSLVPQCGSQQQLVEVAALDEPSSAPLGLLDASLQDATWQLHHSRRSRSWVVALVAHQGVVFFLELLLHKRHQHEAKKDVVMGVWRLARERLEWEVVAWLDVAELQRLTGVECVEREPWVHCFRTGAFGVREFLFCNVWAQGRSFSLGLNLGTREWELFHDPSSFFVAGPVELSQNCFCKLVSHEIVSVASHELLSHLWSLAMEKSGDPLKKAYSNSR